ncbi:aminopeptidase P family protein [Helicobacter pametensis]|uniref:aminopeptidase P family protein n=1 Tax=Helicobacter pametensis TaxID=95149 RepID=UPI0004AEE900|nr:aminopeptidase P family protein [Helicobacter pametensis]
MNPHQERLKLIRSEMLKAKIDAYLIPTSDPHLSEYIPLFWKSIEWISGFSGSAGTLLITQNEAMLWTDGRYWLQAEQQLQNTGFTLQKMSKANTYIHYLLTYIQAKQVIGIDGKILSLETKELLENELAKQGIILNTQCDLIAKIWLQRPPLKQEMIFEHPIEFAIQSREEKLALIQEKMQSLGATHHLINSLEDIAWITNLRGKDIQYNPVFMSYLLIDLHKATLFVQPNTLHKDLIKTLQESHIHLEDYEKITSSLHQLQDAKILIDPSRITTHLINCLSQSNTLIKTHNPSLFLKSIKNPAQIKHIKRAMEQDGIALCHFGYWLETSLDQGMKISELDIDTKLHAFRSSQAYFLEDSFPTIAGFNANGAQCHYRATRQNFSYIQDHGFLLVDSGGNYLNGTTDITRVFPIGHITHEQKQDYTLVLKAHIAMSSTIFPQGILMPMLDSLTRAPLWKRHLDYAHGTGHGVGYCLNVHEGPQVLSYYTLPQEKMKIYEGMITSIEPGIYREGKWGVRLENLVLTQLDGENEIFGKFLRFEPLSLYPFEKNCLLLDLLTEEEIKWINAYHQEVYRRLSPFLDEVMRSWLQEKTSTLQNPTKTKYKNKNTPSF